MGKALEWTAAILGAILLVALAWADLGHAADLPPKAAAAVAVPDFGACTQAMCTGPEISFHISGEGSNADILGSGLNGSIFNQGIGLGGGGGYQFWNGNFLLGLELTGTYYAGSNAGLNSTVAALGGNPQNYNWAIDAVGIAGYGLNGLFNAPPAGASGPINPIQALNGAMITPGFMAGERIRAHGLNGFLAGALVEYTLGGHSALRIDYRHVTYDKGVDAGGLPIHIGTEQEVRATYLYKF